MIIIKCIIFCDDAIKRTYIALDYIKSLYNEKIGVATNLVELEKINPRFNIKVKDEVCFDKPNVICNKIITPYFLQQCLKCNFNIVILPVNYPSKCDGFYLFNYDGSEEFLCIHTIEELELSLQ